MSDNIRYINSIGVELQTEVLHSMYNFGGKYRVKMDWLCRITGYKKSSECVMWKELGVNSRTILQENRTWLDLVKAVSVYVTRIHVFAINI
jgi:hypothetical protein